MQRLLMLAPVKYRMYLSRGGSEGDACGRAATFPNDISRSDPQTYMGVF